MKYDSAILQLKKNETNLRQQVPLARLLLVKISGGKITEWRYSDCILENVELCHGSRL